MSSVSMFPSFGTATQDQRGDDELTHHTIGVDDHITKLKCVQ